MVSTLHSGGHLRRSGFLNQGGGGRTVTRLSHYRRLSLPLDAKTFFEPLIERAEAKAAEAGELTIDDELHLAPLAAEAEDPQVAKLRAALDRRIKSHVLHG